MLNGFEIAYSSRKPVAGLGTEGGTLRKYRRELDGAFMDFALPSILIPTEEISAYTTRTVPKIHHSTNWQPASYVLIYDLISEW